MQRLAILFFLLSFAIARGQIADRTLAITHVTVIDCTGAAAKPDSTVVIQGERIVRIAPSVEVTPDAGSEILDETGKFLIPGMWDMHVHTLETGLPETYFQLFAANGVVGVRDMHGDPLVLQSAQTAIKNGLLPPLRIVSCGRAIEGPLSAIPNAHITHSESDATALVDRLSPQVDFLKVYSNVQRKPYFALAKEARRLGVTFAGHVPIGVSALEASDAGQKSIEHLSGILLACSRDERTLREEMVALQNARLNKKVSFSRMLQATTQPKRLLSTYDETKARKLFEHFAQNRTWQVPTLVVLRAFAKSADPEFLKDPRLKWIPRQIQDKWHPEFEWNSRDRTASDEALAMSRYQKELELVGKMYRAGVPLLAGTDVGCPYILPGFSLLDELQLLAESGIPNLAVLQTATRNPAEYLGRLADAGTIEQGKLADLVLLNANPLEDIRNVNAIAAVWIGGKRMFVDASGD